MIESSEHKDLLEDFFSKKNLSTKNIKETNRVEVYGTEYVISEFVAFEIKQAKKKACQYLVKYKIFL